MAKVTHSSHLNQVKYLDFKSGGNPMKGLKEDDEFLECALLQIKSKYYIIIIKLKVTNTCTRGI